MIPLHYVRCGYSFGLSPQTYRLSASRPPPPSASLARLLFSLAGSAGPGGGSLFFFDVQSWRGERCIKGRGAIIQPPAMDGWWEVGWRAGRGEGSRG